MKKLHWIERSTDSWKLLLKIEEELYRIRILNFNKYDVKYSMYKYERFNHYDQQWTADLNKSRTSIKSKAPIIALKSINTIYLNHVEETKPENIVFTINKSDDNSERKIRIYQYFLNHLKVLDYRVISMDQMDYFAFIAVKKNTKFFKKKDKFFQIKFHQIQFNIKNLDIDSFL